MRLILMLAMLLSAAALAEGAELQTRVTYFTAEAVYLGAGSSSGIHRGNQVTVSRDGVEIVRLNVTFVADGSSSCSIIESFQPLLVGDIANVIIDEPEEVRPVVAIPLVDHNITPGFTANQEPEADNAFKIWYAGSIRLQYSLQDALDRSDQDYQQPSLVARLRIGNAAWKHHVFNINMRLRRNQHLQENGDASGHDWYNRVYRFALSYENPASRWSYQAGRILNNRIRSLGMCDGITGEYSYTPLWTVGLLAGTRPDPLNSAPQTNAMAAGVYLNYEADIWDRTRATGIVVIAGRYNDGAVSEELIRQQGTVRFGSAWRLSQGLKISVNRGWRRRAVGSAISLSSIHTNVHYTPTHNISATVGYNTIGNQRTYETRETPDSLFDDTFRRGLRISTSLKLPHRMLLFARSGLRSTDGGGGLTQTHSGGISQYDILASGFRADVQLSSLRSPVSNGLQYSVSISRSFFKQLDMTAQLGYNRYDNSKTRNVTTGEWLRISAETQLNRQLFISAYSELFRGSSHNENRYFLELGLRL